MAKISRSCQPASWGNRSETNPWAILVEYTRRRSGSAQSLRVIVEDPCSWVSFCRCSLSWLCRPCLWFYAILNVVFDNIFISLHLFMIVNYLIFFSELSYALYLKCWWLF
jgi:hypothetical protein